MQGDTTGPNPRAPRGVLPDVTPSRDDRADPADLAAVRRRRLVRLLLLVAVALVLLSPAFGRSDPTGSYRPALPPDALTDGCWPLPGNVVLGFGYQVRTDDVVGTDEGARRRVVLHFDEISAQEAVSTVTTAFESAGVGDQVQVSAREFEGTAPDAVVRGEMVLDLPPSLPEGRPECQDPFSTKRFTPDMEDRS